MKVLCAFGTRPEAIKMAPVVGSLRKIPGLNVIVAITAQHREMLDSVLDLFSIEPDYDLDLMTPNQSLSGLMSKIVSGFDATLTSTNPDLVMVHGDTSTTLGVSLAAYYHKIPVAHVEAGLRTGNIYSPWPEEANRKIAGTIAALHFAPTEAAKLNLIKENIDKKNIYVTGNTVIDALLQVVSHLEKMPELREKIDGQLGLRTEKKTILVTGHRRENFGAGFKSICDAILELSLRDDLQVLYPVHPNPAVRDAVHKYLRGCANVRLVDPLDYVSFVRAMMKSHIILTDSGGVQEEAPSLGKPVLVMRDDTERPEAVLAGAVKVVGTDLGAILRHVNALMDDDREYARMAEAINPYGDGKSACRIAKLVEQSLI